MNPNFLLPEVNDTRPRLRVQVAFRLDGMHGREVVTCRVARDWENQKHIVHAAFADKVRALGLSTSDIQLVRTYYPKGHEWYRP
jgi:hypothetical protein